MIAPRPVAQLLLPMQCAHPVAILRVVPRAGRHNTVWARSNMQVLQQLEAVTFEEWMLHRAQLMVGDQERRSVCVA